MSEERYNQNRRRRRRRRRANILPALIIVALIAIIIVCILAFCGYNDDDNSQIILPDRGEDLTDNDNENIDETPQEEQPENEIVNPLTGLAVNEDISQLRPFAVMINNIKVATPHSGISRADIIFETLAEGGLTRLMAVYQDIYDMDTIGSVRSARPYFLDIAQGLDAVFVHAGGSDDAYIAIKDRNIDNIDGVHGTGETFFRDSWRKENMGYEHSLMLDPSLLEAYCKEHNVRTEHNGDYDTGLGFSDVPALKDPSSATAVEVVFSGAKSTDFSYDDVLGEYVVSQYGTKMTDSLDGNAVKAKNIVVMSAPISPIPGDTEGRVSENLVGSGKGYFFCNGEVSEILWSKEGYTAPFIYTYSDGTRVQLGRGVTYFCIIPTSGGEVNITE